MLDNCIADLKSNTQTLSNTILVTTDISRSKDAQMKTLVTPMMTVVSALVTASCIGVVSVSVQFVGFCLTAILVFCSSVTVLHMVFDRTLKKTKRKVEDSEQSTKISSSISLSKITQNLEKNLAEQIENYWIDPMKVILDKFLGHGKNAFATMK